MDAKKVTPIAPRLLYSRKSAAHALDVSVRTLDYLIARGEVKTRRVGTRILIPAPELERFATDDHPEPVIVRPVDQASVSPAPGAKNKGADPWLESGAWKGLRDVCQPALATRFLFPFFSSSEMASARCPGARCA